jgi:hypothetical protein
MSTETAITQYYAGDAVALVDQVPHRAALKPGLEGTVLVGDESDAEIWALVSVAFPRLTPHCWQLHRKHLRLVARGSTEVLEADDDA